MKKIIYLFIVLTVFLIGPLSFRGASNCSGTCTYYVPYCGSPGGGEVGFESYYQYLPKNAVFFEIKSAEAYNSFLSHTHYSGENSEYITTTSSGEKRIMGRYVYFTINPSFESTDNVIVKQEQWYSHHYDHYPALAAEEPAFLVPDSNSKFYLKRIEVPVIKVEEFINIKNGCICPKVFVQKYCMSENLIVKESGGPIVLEQYIDNEDAIYHEMTLIPEESKLEESESANEKENSETISLSEVDKQVYPTEYTIIYSFEPGYDLFWRVEIQKKNNPELYSGKFVAVLKKHGQYYETDKVTYYTGIDLRAIDNQDLDDPNFFKTKATITDDKLNACIDRALHPEKYNNYYDNLYKTKCELSKRTKDTDTFFSINWDDIQLYNTEGQPIKCSDFDLDNGENLVKMLFTIIKIIAPVLVIVFGSLDFAKAIFQADEEKQKKAGQDFIKRLIAAALIFLIPTILEIILGVAFNWDEAIPSICVK